MFVINLELLQLFMLFSSVQLANMQIIFSQPVSVSSGSGDRHTSIDCSNDSHIISRTIFPQSGPQISESSNYGSGGKLRL